MLMPYFVCIGNGVYDAYNTGSGPVHDNWSLDARLQKRHNIDCHFGLHLAGTKE